MRKQGIAGIRIREPRFLKFFYEIHAKNSVNYLFLNFNVSLWSEKISRSILYD